MNALGMGAIINGFLGGLDKQNEINYQNGERKHASERRAVQEQRQDTEWNQGQQDRQRKLDRQTVLEGREDTKYGQDQEAYQHGLSRRPIEESQKDQQFGLGVARTQQEMRLADNRDRRDSAESAQRQRLNAIRAELDQYGLDDARVAADYKKAERELTPLFQQYQATRDPTIFQDWYNSHVPDGNQIQIQRNQDGTVTINSQRGTSQTLPSGDDVARLARTFVRPDVYMESLYAGVKAQQEAAAARAKNPKAFGEPVQGSDGTTGMLDYTTGKVTPITGADGKPFSGVVHGAGAGQRPAMLQEVDALLQNMPQRDGESSTDRWMRAYATANQRTQTSPDQAMRDFYKSTLTKLLPDAQYSTPRKADLDRAQQQAAELTLQFRDRYLGGSTPAQGGPLTAMAQGRPANQQQGGTSTQAVPQGRRKFIEGKVYRDANGNVARYVNGQFVPMQ